VVGRSDAGGVVSGTRSEMKDETPSLPDKVPAKRRQLEAALDVHIAMWLAGDSITPSERRRLEGEKKRRRVIKGPRVGLLVGPEGCTPDQFDVIAKMICEAGASEFAYIRLPHALHQMCRKTGARVAHWPDVKNDTDIIKSSDVLFAAPRSYRHSNDVWRAVRRARDRRLRVMAVMPDGRINTEGNPQDVE
jgi:hypothetical protein